MSTKNQERFFVPSPGDLIDGKYEVQGIIGEGGMGVVLDAINRKTDKPVAIKWLLPRLSDDPAAVKRFELEAKAAGRIDHPNVVNVFDVGQAGENSFIVMEKLVGETLSALLNERQQAGRSLSLSETAAIFVPALRGVAAAHDKNVVHRDLKPENIFISNPKDGGEKIPKILDFGISKMTRNTDSSSTLTKAGTRLGTFLYMSPEQLRGQKTDHRTDIYALGIILYKMLSLEMPYEADNEVDLALKIHSNEPRPLAERVASIPVEIDRISRKAISRDPDDRFQDVKSFALALERVFGERLGDREQTDKAGRSEQASQNSGAGPSAIATKSSKTEDDSRIDTPYSAVVESIKTDGVVTSKFRGVFWGILSLAAFALILIAFRLNISNSTSETTGTTETTPAVTVPEASSNDRKSGESASPRRSSTESVNSPAPFESDWTIPKISSDSEPIHKTKPSSSQTLSTEASITASEEPAQVRDDRSSRRRIAEVDNARSKRPPSSKRVIALHNKLRATIKVTLVCGDVTKTVIVSSQGKESARVPKPMCQIRCEGVGGPVCPSTLDANTNSLEIH